MNNKNGWVRWVANILQLPGYYLLIHDTFVIGLALKAISDFLLIYWGWRNKLYDVVAITSIFALMNMQRCYQLIEGGTIKLMLYSMASRLHLLG